MGHTSQTPCVLKRPGQAGSTTMEPDEAVWSRGQGEGGGLGTLGSLVFGAPGSGALWVVGEKGRSNTTS